MKIKCNVPLQGNLAGAIIDIQDESGIPLSPYWRKRLKDSESDECITVIGNKKKTETKKRGELSDD